MDEFKKQLKNLQDRQLEETRMLAVRITSA